MNISAYQTTGIKKLTSLKKDFVPFNFDSEGEKEKALIRDFIHVFCDHQLADNDYMNIQLHSHLNDPNAKWFYQLSLEKILKHITHIIWTDKVVKNYFASKVKDNTIYHLLNQLEKLETEASWVNAK